MELKQYWRIFARRWWVVVLITVLSGLLSVAFEVRTGLSYVATMRVVTSVPPEPKAPDNYNYDKYYTWLSSEYLVDDLSEIVKSRSFLDDVQVELNDPSIDVKTLIEGERATKKTHRILAIKVTSNNKGQALAVANAAARVIEKKGKEYLLQLSYGDAQVKVIDPPEVALDGGGLRAALNIALRTALGFLAGVALIFLLYYLDSTIYDADDVERRLGMRVLGELPPGV